MHYSVVVFFITRLLARMKGSLKTSLQQWMSVKVKFVLLDFSYLLRVIYGITFSYCMVKLTIMIWFGHHRVRFDTFSGFWNYSLDHLPNCTPLRPIILNAHQACHSPLKLNLASIPSQRNRTKTKSSWWVSHNSWKLIDIVLLFSRSIDVCLLPCPGISRIEGLQTHQNFEVYKAALAIIDKFFSEEVTLQLLCC